MKHYFCPKCDIVHYENDKDYKEHKVFLTLKNMIITEWENNNIYPK